MVGTDNVWSAGSSDSNPGEKIRDPRWCDLSPKASAASQGSISREVDEGERTPRGRG